MKFQAYDSKGNKIPYAMEEDDYVLDENGDRVSDDFTEIQALLKTIHNKQQQVEERFQLAMLGHHGVLENGVSAIVQDPLLKTVYKKAQSEGLDEVTILKYCCIVLNNRAVMMADDLIKVKEGK